MKYAIGRPINGIAINGLEYVVNNYTERARLLFTTEESAIDFLHKCGYSDERIESEGIIIVEQKEVKT